MTDAILGQDFMARHKNVKIHFGGEIPTLHLGPLQAIKTSTPVKLFEHLRENTQPVATKPRRYSQADTEFISSEVKRLLNDDLIEPNSSPWRAQPLVVTQVNHKKRMVIDYSQTVNKFTLLDAYPLPHMQDIVRRIAQYKVYSMLDLTSAYHTKIKNAKLLRWRIELSQFEYDIVYRAGKFNTAADTMSKIYCANLNFSSLYEIHAGLCHPGITRTYYFIKMKNLPYSIEEVRKIVNGCRVCAEIKPRFHKLIESHLIKATQPMERLSIDFKGPLPSSYKNKYLLAVVDKYSRFPFAFACSNIESQTVINCLQQIFYLFGAPGYVHSDQGKSFVSNEIVSFFAQFTHSHQQNIVYNQWWILGEANEAVASGSPLFGWPPLENSIYSFGFAQWTIWSEDLFFFFLENTLILGEKYPSPDQTSFFSQTT